MQPRPTRWQRAWKDWPKIQWRDLILSAFGLGIAILVLEESNFSGSTVAEVGIVAGSAIAAGVLYALAQLVWAWLQAPMRLLTDDVVAIREKLEAAPPQTPIRLPRAINDSVRKGHALLRKSEFSEQDAFDWANEIASILNEYGDYKDGARFSRAQGGGDARGTLKAQIAALDEIVERLERHWGVPKEG
jgi:hypothetical protein